MYEKQESLYVTLAAIVVVVSLFLYANSLSISGESASAPQVSQGSGGNTVPAAPALSRGDILALVAAHRPLSFADKRKLFVSLAGKRFEQYNFSEKEIAAIVKSLNGE